MASAGEDVARTDAMGNVEANSGIYAARFPQWPDMMIVWHSKAEETKCCHLLTFRGI